MESTTGYKTAKLRPNKWPVAIHHRATGLFMFFLKSSSDNINYGLDKRKKC